MPEIGPHLLGRKYEPDPRDFQLAHFLTATDPLDAVTTSLLASTAHPAVRAWAKIAAPRIKAASPYVPPQPPPPPPATTDVVWSDSDVVLDQGDTPRCVGFAWAGFADTLPIDDHYTNADGDAIYAAAKVIDGEPGVQDGTSVRSGAKAMQDRKRIAVYAFAKTIDEVIAWVRTKGPVVFGTDWYNGMFDVDDLGFVHPTGGVAGGHAYLCCGDLPGKGALRFQNSWGQWGEHGRFSMTYADAAVLLAAQGDACASVELPV